MSIGKFLPPLPLGRPERPEDAASWLKRLFEKDAAGKPALRDLGGAICRRLSWIETYARRACGDRGRGPEFAERVYEKLKPRIHSLRNLDACVVTEVKYELRRDRAAIQSQLSLEGYAELSDPDSVKFVADLINRDRIHHVRGCMEHEFRMLFDSVFLTAKSETRESIAARLGISRNALDQRLNRGLSRTREEYCRRYGSAP